MERRTGSGILGLILLLIWVEGISRRRLRTSEKPLVNAREFWYPNVQQLHRPMIAISLVSVHHDGRWHCAGSLCLGSGVGQSSLKLISGLMLTLLCFLGLLVSRVGLGFRLMVGASLVLMLLPGRFVFVCCVSCHPFWVRFTGRLTLATFSTTGSLIWRF